jgi:hypothetical protein
MSPPLPMRDDGKHTYCSIFLGIGIVSPYLPFMVFGLHDIGLISMRCLLVLALSLVSLIPTATNSMQMPTATPDSSQSIELNSLNSEKTSLQKQRRDLEGRQDSWHTAYLWLAIVAVVLGAFSWISQRFESKNARQERPLTSRVSQIDERIREIEKLISDRALAETGAVAANATKDAGIANKAAGDANERAGKLEKEAGEERIRASNIEKDTALLKQQNLATESRLAEANQRLELERMTRLDLEASIAPRAFGPNIQIAPLKSYAGVEVIFECVPDMEAITAAKLLSEVLMVAGWKQPAEIKILPLTPESLAGLSGVTIYRYFRHLPVVENPHESMSSKAAEALESFLSDHDWRVMLYDDTNDSVGPNEVKVHIGMKPTPHFEPALEREIEEKIKQIQRDSEKESPPS